VRYKTSDISETKQSTAKLTKKCLYKLVYDQSTGEKSGDLDVDVERMYERRPRPLCPPHLVTLLHYSFLRFFIQKLAMTSGYLQLCPGIISLGLHNILIVTCRGTRVTGTIGQSNGMESFASLIYYFAFGCFVMTSSVRV